MSWSQPVHDESIIELHDQGDEADPSVVVGFGEISFLRDGDYDENLPFLRNSTF